MSAPRTLLLLLRIGAGLQVLLGVAFWTGHAYALVNVHRTIGMLFVLTLWALGALAMRQPSLRALATFVILWGIVIVAVGMTQQRILIGDYHWVVRVAHLVIGLAPMPIAERLARGAEVEGPRAVAA